MSRYKLLIADDHILFNEGVRQLLSDNFDIVGQVYDGKEVLPTIHLQKPNVILLDINLPSINGFDLAKEIKRAFASIKIIFLSMYNESRFVEQSKLLQVNGYLLKNSTKEELIEGIESIMRGETYYDSKLLQPKVSLHHNDFFVKQY